MYVQPVDIREVHVRNGIVIHGGHLRSVPYSQTRSRPHSVSESRRLLTLRDLEAEADVKLGLFNCQ